MNYMVDLETLSTQPNATILSIGIVKFDKEQIHGSIHLFPDIHQNRHICPDTVSWWFTRGGFKPENPIGIQESIFKINAFMQDVPIKDRKVWGNGSDFDNVILNSFLGTQLWYHSGNRCYRTMKNLFPLPYTFQGDKHDALNDAMNQTKHLQAICAKYSINL